MNIISLNTVSEKCGVEKHQELVIKTEAVEEVDGSFISQKLKCENLQTDSSCDESSELNNFDVTCTPCFIKKEPEDSPSPPDADDLGQMQTENFELKEEINIEEHELGWELLNRRSSSSGILNPEIDRIDSVQENGLQSSEWTSDGGAKFHCDHCPFTTIRKFNLIIHYKLKHKQFTEIIEVYKCNQCLYYESEIKRDLVSHCRDKHSRQNQMYKCQECLFETKKKNDLIKHYKCRHATDVYKCDECSFETVHKGNLTKHYKHKHTKETVVYKCRECSFFTRFKSALTRHYKIKHSEDAEVYKCQECSYETKNKSHWTQHYKHQHSKYTDMFKKCTLTRHFKHKHLK